MKRYTRFFVLLLAGALLLSCAACGSKRRYFPMQGANLADLRSDEIVWRIAEITGAADDNILASDGNFGLQVSGDFMWSFTNVIEMNLTKKTLGGSKFYRCQLQIKPDESQFFVTDIWKNSPSERQYALREYLDALKYLPQKQIRTLAPEETDLYLIDVIEGGMPDDDQPCIFYDKDGVTERRDWLIRLDVLPTVRDEQNDGSHIGVGEDRIHLFFIAAP